MTFEERVKCLRNLPQFKVLSISEIKAIAFAAKEEKGQLVLGQNDIQKIIREYPNLEPKLKALNSGFVYRLR